MADAQHGDTVKVHYTGKLTDGTIFDSSTERDPLEFTLGAGNVIPGFEAAVVGMSPGDNKTVTIIAEEAYGPHHKEAIQEFPRSSIPEHVELEIGVRIQASDSDGRAIILTVLSLDDEVVVLDANHPLAGQDLTFDLELVDVA